MQITPVILIDKADGRDLRPGGNAPQMLHLLGTERAVDSLEIIVLIFTHCVFLLIFVLERHSCFAGQVAFSTIGWTRISISAVEVRQVTADAYPSDTSARYNIWSSFCNT
jgi:hypothetical protein